MRRPMQWNYAAGATRAEKLCSKEVWRAGSRKRRILLLDETKRYKV